MRSLARLGADRAGMPERLGDRLPFRTAFDVHGTRVDVRASAPEPVHYLNRMFGAFRHHGTPGDPGPHDLRLMLVDPTTDAGAVLSDALRVPRRLTGPTIVCSWSPWAVVCGEPGDVHYYASKLTRLGIVEASRAEHVTLHAAALSGESSGVLLLGEAAAGKTTLTGQLTERGFRFAADDSVPVRRRDLACLPFPTPLVSRSPRGAGRGPDVTVVGEPRWLLPHDGPISPPFRATHVFALDGRDHGPPRPLGLTDAALTLLRSVVLPLGSRESWADLVDRDLDDLVAIAAGARCTVLPTGDLHRALDHVLDATRSVRYA